MAKKIEFTKLDRYIIAEFYHSYQQEILIKSDVVCLISVLRKNNVITSLKTWSLFSEETPDRLFVMISHVFPDQLKEIMEEYYKN